MFSPEGDLIRQQTAPAQGFGALWRGGIDPGGRVWDDLFELREADAPERLGRTSADWSQVDTLELPLCLRPGWHRRDALYSKPIEGTPLARYAYPVPFYPAPVQAFDWRSGAVWCAPSGAEYRLVKLDIESHDTLATIAGGGEPVQVGPAERDSAIGELRKFLRRMGEPDVDWARIPAVKPLVAGAAVDAEGRLWVQRSSADSTSQFDLYSETGQPIATVPTSCEDTSR
ncbi:MAG: hypothetical protein AB7L66_05810 [Gemmatimonadales bacterium]